MNGFYFGTFQKTRGKTEIAQNPAKSADIDRRIAKFDTKNPLERAFWWRKKKSLD
jgi:hypothetical protein